MDGSRAQVSGRLVAGLPIAANVFLSVKDEDKPRAVDLARRLSRLGFKLFSTGGTAKVLADNADKVEQYRGGKEALFGFFVGQTMKAMQGKANPQVVNEAVKKGLG